MVAVTMADLIMVVEDIMAAAGAIMALEEAMAVPVSAFISAHRFILILTTAIPTGTRIIIRPP